MRTVPEPGTGGSEIKASACNAGDLGSIPESGRSSGEGNGHPLQYSYLENSKDRGAGEAAVLGSQRTGPDYETNFHFSAFSNEYTF